MMKKEFKIPGNLLEEETLKDFKGIAIIDTKKVGDFWTITVKELHPPQQITINGKRYVIEETRGAVEEYLNDWI